MRQQPRSNLFSLTAKLDSCEGSNCLGIFPDQAFSSRANAYKFLSFDSDNTVRLWRSDVSCRSIKIDRPSSAAFSCLTLDKTFQKAICGHIDGTVSLYAVSAKKKNRITCKPHYKKVNHVRLSKSEDLMVTCSNDHLAKLFKIRPSTPNSSNKQKENLPKFLHSFQPSPKFVLKSQFTSTQGLALMQSCGVSLYDLSSLQISQTIENSTPLKDFYLDNNIVLLLDINAKVNLYDLRTGNIVGGFQRRHGILNVTDFDIDSKKLVYHCYSEDGFCSMNGWEYWNRHLGHQFKGKLHSLKKKTNSSLKKESSLNSRKQFPSESWLHVVDYRFPKQRNMEMRIGKGLFVNDLKFIRSSESLLLASNLGVQTWELSKFSEGKLLSTSLQAAKNSQKDKKSGRIKLLDKAIKSRAIKKFENNKNQMNFATKYSFGFGKENNAQSSNEIISQEDSIKEKKVSSPRDLFLLSSIPKAKTSKQQILKSQNKKVPKLNTVKNSQIPDPEIQYSFPLKKAAKNSPKGQTEKGTLEYLKAQNRIDTFEKNLSEINGK